MARSCKLIALILIFLFSISLFKNTNASESIFQTFQIIGKNEWINYRQTGGNIQNANERTVALLTIPAMMTTCNAFLINADTIMTNNHCISSASKAFNVTATFRDNDGQKTTYPCHQMITTNALFDFTLLKCENSPGQKFGWAQLAKDQAQKDTRIYVIQENCDYLSDPHCSIDKYVSFGAVLESEKSRIFHDADTLGGSSGSPVFSQNTNQVIALHNAGATLNSSRKELNSAIPIFQILKIIKATTAVKL